MRLFYSVTFSILFGLAGCSNEPVHKYQGYVSGRNIYLASQFSGKLKKLSVDKGSLVKKGDLLFALDPEPQSFTLKENEAVLLQNKASLADLIKPKREPTLDAIHAQLAQNQAQISLATIRVKRNQTLFDKHVLAKDSLDLTKENLNVLLAKKDQLLANLDLAKLGARKNVIRAQKSKIQVISKKIKSLNWALEQKKVFAPDDGYIFDTFFCESEFIGSGRPVLALLTKENIYIEFFVPFEEVQNISIGSYINYGYTDDSKNIHKAKITYISPKAEYIPPLVYSRKNMDKLVFKLKAQPDESDNLLPGLPVTVSIDSNHEK
jgi:HlyD family secretion protein